tara:strand:+ start:269 stop:568 length:300 start_codon:yes stop_codon:yes gene_type:complete
MKTFKQFKELYGYGSPDFYRPITDIGNMKSPYNRPQYGINATAKGDGLGTYFPMNIMAKKLKDLKKRNPIAKDLRSNPLFKKQIVKPKKGKGSYDRKKT